MYAAISEREHGVSSKRILCYTDYATLQTHLVL